MRHGKKFNHLGRKKGHREALLSNMASSLIMHKRIFTTIAKAKALRKYVEPLITKSKDDTTHSRRVVFSYLRDKESTKELFSTVADKVGTRPGGYTRILKTGQRAGDNAEMAMMELVDFNELMLEHSDDKKATAGKKRTRRSKKAAPNTAPVADTADAIVEAEVIEETAVEEVAEVIEETVAEVAETKEPVEEKAEKAEEAEPEAKVEKEATKKAAKKDDKKDEE
jgi:large subunit ribosomal protein L17